MESTRVTSRRVTLSVDGDARHGGNTDRDANTRQDGGGVDLRYLVGGDGPPVVLLHGIGFDAATVSWRHALPTLARDYRVYAPDFPGHGRSEKPTGRYTTGYYLRVLSAFLETLEIDRPRIVGISMGGAVGLGLALDDDSDLARLVLVDSYGLGSDAPWRPGASALLRTPFANGLGWAALGSNRAAVRAYLQTIVSGRPSKPLVEDVYRAVQDHGVGRAMSSWQRSEFRPDGFETCYTGQLSDLQVPTLLVHGEADPLLPTRWSERAVDRIPESELDIFERCGHWPPRERPKKFVRVLGRFLNGNSHRSR